MGGLDLHDLRVEQGVACVLLFMRHVYNDTETGKMLLIALKYLQMEAGTEAQILRDTVTPLGYITQCWLTVMRNFMGQHQMNLQLTNSWNFFLSRANDAFLMDIFQQSKSYSMLDLKNLNAVRMYLQVATVSDISTAEG